jgi:hypothetical protein
VGRDAGREGVAGRRFAVGPQTTGGLPHRVSRKRHRSGGTRQDTSFTTISRCLHRNLSWPNCARPSWTGKRPAASFPKKPKHTAESNRLKDSVHVRATGTAHTSKSDAIGLVVVPR